MKKCDHCEKKAFVTYDTEPATGRPARYIGGLCEEHDTEKNRDVIVERWKKAI